MVKIKICGITNKEDACMVVAAGADAVGFVFHEPSPRHVTVEQAAAIIRELPPFVQVVGLFVDRPIEFVNQTAQACRLDIIQLHGEETPEYCSLVNRRVIKAFRIKGAESLIPLPQYRVAGYLLDAWSPDAHGGTGTTFNWDLARDAGMFGPIVLAGGLTPENVAEAVRTVSPYAVDVSSGVEVSPGRKDSEKVFRFIHNCRRLTGQASISSPA